MQARGSVKTLLHVFPSLEIGGNQRRFAQIANKLAGKYRHILFATDGNYEALNLLSSGVIFERLEDRVGVVGNSRSKIFNALRRIAPDLLLTYNWGSIEWALIGRLFKLPHIHHEDGFGPEESQRQFLRRVLARRLILNGSTDVVVPSQSLKTIAQNSWRISEQQLHYLPNGVDTDRFTPIRSRGAIADMGIPASKYYLGTVAALRREKNIFRLIDAFNGTAENTDARLLIVGAGPLESELKSYANDLKFGNRIHFLGMQSSPEKILSGLDLFVLSSDTEQMPISVLEAMACGLPVVATHVGDIETMVTKSNKKFIVEPRADALARAILDLLADDELRHGLGAENLKKVRAEYSLEKMISRYDSLYGKWCEP
ncbi:MAG: glycosyltransferase family 1 protein [Alphaproteobacteria bacterium]|nr:MAG: glycosyltransferase family 1 protein [Alphaproteobacteria bacterium]